jgi:hypothetical protein
MPKKGLFYLPKGKANASTVEKGTKKASFEGVLGHLALSSKR